MKKCCCRGLKSSDEMCSSSFSHIHWTNTICNWLRAVRWSLVTQTSVDCHTSLEHVRHVMWCFSRALRFRLVFLSVGLQVIMKLSENGRKSDVQLTVIKEDRKEAEITEVYLLGFIVSCGLINICSSRMMYVRCSLLKTTCISSFEYTDSWFWSFSWDLSTITIYTSCV